jgi:hypothetical protein
LLDLRREAKARGSDIVLPGIGADQFLSALVDGRRSGDR